VLRSLHPRALIVKSRELVRAALDSQTVSTGEIFDITLWWRCVMDRTKQVGGRRSDTAHVGISARTRLLHPLKYAKRLTSDGVCICRYHNYSECKHDPCPYDHTHCHCCGHRGHAAKNCETFRAAAFEAQLAGGAAGDDVSCNADLRVCDDVSCNADPRVCDDAGV
jgi:hypothetical protein